MATARRATPSAIGAGGVPHERHVRTHGSASADSVADDSIRASRPPAGRPSASAGSTRYAGAGEPGTGQQAPRDGDDGDEHGPQRDLGHRAQDRGGDGASASGVAGAAACRPRHARREQTERRDGGDERGRDGERQRDPDRREHPRGDGAPRDPRGAEVTGQDPAEPAERPADRVRRQVQLGAQGVERRRVDPALGVAGAQDGRGGIGVHSQGSAAITMVSATTARPAEAQGSSRRTAVIAGSSR